MRSVHANPGVRTVRSEATITDGLRVREAAIGFLSGPHLRRTVGSATASGAPGGVIRDALPAEIAALVRRDLICDAGWTREYWVLDEDSAVHRVEPQRFEETRPDLRFSRYSCLRSPHRDSLALRAVLSAAVDRRCLANLADACGTPLRFVSADVGAYGCGDYLRRHSDVFDHRVFGMVWFFNEDRPPAAGGELVVETGSGECTVVEPLAGSVAVIPFHPSAHHLVASVRSERWRRYSIAIHYAAAG